MKILHLSHLARLVGLKDALTYRPKAKEMYNLAMKQLDTLLDGDLIVCSFQEIITCATSFVDEFVINLQKDIALQENIILALVDVSEEVLDDIKSALLLRNEKDNTRINLLCHDQSGFMILGKLENNLQETFKIVASRSETSARDIAQEFETQINSASNRLKKLYNLNLIFRREMIDENGRQHLYFLPTI